MKYISEVKFGFCLYDLIQELDFEDVGDFKCYEFNVFVYFLFFRDGVFLLFREFKSVCEEMVFYLSMVD